jgi:protein-disulfide isomerase
MALLYRIAKGRTKVYTWYSKYKESYFVNKKTWIIFIVICVAVLGALVFMSRSQKVDVSSINPYSIQPASKASGNIADHVYGNKDSKVLLVEYGDFQCPSCGAAYPIIKQVKEEYKDKIAFVFRNNPLPTLHPNAKAAAAAGEAAGLQGKFWEMHNKLYDLQDSWSNLDTNQRTDAFVSYAKEVGVKDINKFKADMSADNVGAKINFDLSLGQKIGVTGTPTFTLNGDTLSSDQRASVDALKKAIDAKLKEAGQ